jgi:adenosine deaminase
MRSGVPLGELFSETNPAWWSSRHERRWSDFQDRYDLARSTIRNASHIQRILCETAEDNARDGAVWVEIQFDPTSYLEVLGGVRPAIETLLDAIQQAADSAGLGMALIIAASWAGSPKKAEELASVAGEYAQEGVVGFGLSNDERLNMPGTFVKAAKIARSAGLAFVPHSGFFTGPSHIRSCVEELGADRVGHGIRAADDDETVKLLASRGVALEICLTSYEPLGVVPDIASVPLRSLFEAGVPIAIGSDDPLLFLSGIADQYSLARQLFGFTDTDLAELARSSLRSSRAPTEIKERYLNEIDAWLAAG